MYMLQQGPTERTIVEQCARNGLPLPRAIANAPELLVGLELYFIGFMDLTTCRGQSYGTEGPISWITMNEYCFVHGIDGEQREDFFYHLSRMDSAYLEYKAKKLSAQTGNK